MERLVEYLKRYLASAVISVMIAKLTKRYVKNDLLRVVLSAVFVALAQRAVEEYVLPEL